jgi:hypothetical protein
MNFLACKFTHANVFISQMSVFYTYVSLQFLCQFCLIDFGFPMSFSCPIVIHITIKYLISFDTSTFLEIFISYLEYLFFHENFKILEHTAINPSKKTDWNSN